MAQGDTAGRPTRAGGPGATCHPVAVEHVDAGLLVLRLALGLTLAMHGYNKFFGGGRIPGTAGWFDSIGMKPGLFHARVAASTEIAAGLGLALGLLTPIPAAGFVALMLVAAWTVHRHNGFFIVKEGWEYNLVLAVAAVAIAGTGPGRYSLDHLLFSGTDLASSIGKPSIAHTRTVEPADASRLPSGENTTRRTAPSVTNTRAPPRCISTSHTVPSCPPLAT